MLGKGSKERIAPFGGPAAAAAGALGRRLAERDMHAHEQHDEFARRRRRPALLRVEQPQVAAARTLGALVKYREDADRVKHALDRMLAR